MGELIVNVRLERIERLLHELKYEVTRGVMEREIEEQLQFIFFVPSRRKHSLVVCQFVTSVEPQLYGQPHETKLRVVKKP